MFIVIFKLMLVVDYSRFTQCIYSAIGRMWRRVYKRNTRAGTEGTQDSSNRSQSDKRIRRLLGKTQDDKRMQGRPSHRNAPQGSEQHPQKGDGS